MDNIRSHTYYYLVVYSIAVIILSRFGLLFYFCMVPLHLLYRAYPANVFFKTAGVLTAGIVLWDILKYTGIGLSGSAYLLAAIGMFYPAMLLMSTLLYYLPAVSSRQIRMGIASLLPAAAGTIIIVLLNGNSPAAGDVIDFYSRIFSEILSSAMPGAQELGSADFLFLLALEIMKATFLPFWFILFGSGVLLSEIAVQRKSSAAGPVKTFLDNFSVSDKLLWPFIGSWMLVLLDIVFGLGTFGDLIWNAALVFLLFYGTAGISILSYWSRKKHVRMHPLSWVILAIFLLFIPGINVILIIAVPVLGLSEHWIHYRLASKEKIDENNTE
jgi:hypothetical protein